VTGASERVSGRASDPVLQSVFFVFLAHSAEEDDNRPIVASIIRDWDAMELLWQRALSEVGGESVGELPLLITESPLNEPKERAQMAEILFEKFNVPSLYIPTAAYLSLIASGLTKGIVVDIGYDVTYFVHFRDEHVDRDTVTTLDIDRDTVTTIDVGGRHLDQRLASLLEAKHGKRNAFDVQEGVVTRIKEAHCCVAPKEEYSSEKTQVETVNYALPDGEVVPLDQEMRTGCTEVLFDPSLAGSSAPGIHQAAYNSLKEYKKTREGSWWHHLVFSGGTACAPGMMERLRSEFGLNSFLMEANMDVRSYYPSRFMVGAGNFKGAPVKYVSWMGGSLLGSLSISPSFFTTKSDYEEKGEIKMSCLKTEAPTRMPRDEIWM